MGSKNNRTQATETKTNSKTMSCYSFVNCLAVEPALRGYMKKKYGANTVKTVFEWVKISIDEKIMKEVPTTFDDLLSSNEKELLKKV
jgi:hypothetical protein